MQAQVYGLRMVITTEMCLLNVTIRFAGAALRHARIKPNYNCHALTIYSFNLWFDSAWFRARFASRSYTVNLKTCLTRHVANDLHTRLLVRALRRCRCNHLVVVHAVVCMPICLTVSPSLSLNVLPKL